MDYREAFRNVHPFTKLLMLMLIVFVSFIVVMGVGMFVAIPFLGDAVYALLRGEELDPDNLQIMKYFQVLSHLGMFILPSVLFAVIISRHPRQYLAAERYPHLKPVLLGLLIMFAALPLVGYLAELNHMVSFPELLKPLEEWMRNTEATAEKLTERFLRMYTWQEFAFNLFMIAIIPAIGEEFIFRGIVQKLFTQWTRNRHVAVFIAAFLFSAMHLQFFSFLPRFALGIILGYMLLFSGNIWFPVLAHFVNNAAALVFYYFYESGQIKLDMDDIGAGPMGPVLAASSLVVIIALFVAFRQAAKKGLSVKV